MAANVTAWLVEIRTPPPPPPSSSSHEIFPSLPPWQPNPEPRRLLSSTISSVTEPATGTLRLLMRVVSTDTVAAIDDGVVAS
jgi:hypothetical protein